jgi:hypothetical protein
MQAPISIQVMAGQVRPGLSSDIGIMRARAGKGAPRRRVFPCHFETFRFVPSRIRAFLARPAMAWNVKLQRRE